MRKYEVNLHNWLCGFEYVIRGDRFEGGKHKYITFFRNKANEDLFIKLEKDGFFDFHISNEKKSVVSYHQVVAFYCCGGREMLGKGYTCKSGSHEVHHEDGDTLNNESGNLSYTPVQFHYMFTMAQRRMSKGFKHFRKLSRNLVQSVLVWNKKGEVVTRVFDWLRSILTKTVIKTAAYLGIEIKVKELWRFARAVVSRCKIGLDKTLLVRSYFLHQEGLSSTQQMITN